MSRERKPRKVYPAIAVLVDGNDEQWYVSKVRDHYPCDALRTIKIRPELPRRKKVQELFDLAKSKLEEEYTFVIIMFDLDEPLRNPKEFEKFKELYTLYLFAQENSLKGRQKTNYNWMKKILLIVNNPCLEYWYLLHYRRTTKFFADYTALCSELRKIPELAKYKKDEDYYNCHPNIYERLSRNNGLENARRNAIKFDLNNCKNQGCSEMNLFFDYFDSL